MFLITRKFASTAMAATPSFQWKLGLFLSFAVRFPTNCTVLASEGFGLIRLGGCLPSTGAKEWKAAQEEREVTNHCQHLRALDTMPTCDSVPYFGRILHHTVSSRHARDAFMWFFLGCGPTWAQLPNLHISGHHVCDVSGHSAGRSSRANICENHSGSRGRTWSYLLALPMFERASLTCLQGLVHYQVKGYAASNPYKAEAIYNLKAWAVGQWSHRAIYVVKFPVRGWGWRGCTSPTLDLQPLERSLTDQPGGPVGGLGFRV